MKSRLEGLSAWVFDQLAATGWTGLQERGVVPVSGDASFRRYFRVWAVKDNNISSFVVMDAPPDKEDTGPFVRVAQCLEQQGLHVPHIYAQDDVHGYLLLSDLGDDLYLPHLSSDTVEKMYQQAFTALLKMQHCQMPTLPLYDAHLLHKEMSLFCEWCCERLLEKPLTAAEKNLVESTFQKLIGSALNQPQVFVHRDYHSRNLMVTTQHQPGILDFQDAVIGPITYDLVSLLRDCYIVWPSEKVKQWALQFAQLAINEKLMAPVSDTVFLQWFDWMGIQRHIKVLGIFSRLCLRDAKPNYLHDIPRVFNYVLQVGEQYDELHDFTKWINQDIYPKWNMFYKNFQAVNS